MRRIRCVSVAILKTLVLIGVCGHGLAAPKLNLPGAPNGAIAPTPPPPSAPVITGLSYSGNCVKKNATFSILGRNFAAQPGKGIGLLVPASVPGGGHVHINVLLWTDQKITARLPSNDPKVKGGGRYRVGVELKSSHSWLSNATKSFTVCGSVPSPALKTRDPARAVTEPTGGIRPVPGGFSADPGGSGPEQDPTDFDMPVMDQVPINSGGGLLGGELPPPPEDLPPPPPANDRRVVPRELVAVSANMAEAQALARNARARGLKVIRRRNLGSLGLVVSVIRVPEGVNTAATLKNLRKAAPKLLVDSQHRLTMQGDESKRYGTKLIGWRPAAHSDGAGMRVGLVDTAVDTAHPALRGQSITTRSFVTPGIPQAQPAHGTAIASLLVANPEQKSFVGLLPGARLYAANVFRARGKRDIDTTAEWVVLALDWLASQRIQIINLSLGGPRNLLLEVAVGKLLQRGVVIVAAAGNAGPKAAPIYPAAQKGVIAVTAVDAEYNVYPRANRGNYISLAAPGVDVWAAKPGGSGAYVSGTSYAVPFVTASLIAAKMAKPKTSWRTLRTRLERQARDLGSPGKDPVFGWGLVQAPRASIDAKK